MKLKIILITTFAFALSACTTTAPPFQPDFSNTNQLKAQGIDKLSVGEFKAADENVEKITIRGGTMKSPYGSYTSYLETGLTESLKQANLWSGVSNYRVSGVLEQNDFDASGISIGEADMSVRFVVTKDEDEVYNKVHTVHHEWESSFMGAVAIPNALQNYSVVVQKVLAKLFEDQEFIQAVK